MKPYPYKINVARMSHRILQMDLVGQYCAVENLLHYHTAKIIQVSNLLDLAKTVKVDLRLILVDIAMIETEAEIFKFGKKISELQKLGFVENTKVIAINLNQQLAKIYQKSIQ